MSGLEFVAVLGIAASAIEIVSACTKIIERIKRHGHSVAFEDLKTQLQLFSKEIGHLSDPMDHFDAEPTTEAILGEVLKGCRRQLEKLDTILQSVIPGSGSSKLRRTIYGIRSVAKEKEVREILSILSTYQATILVHLSRRNIQNTAQIPKLISLVEARVLSEESYRSESPTEQIRHKPVPEASMIATSRPRRPRNRQNLRRASKCSRGICDCQCHISSHGIPRCWIVVDFVRGIFCGCDKQEYSMAIQLFRNFCVLKLSKNWADGVSITCSLQYYGIVKYTFPGFLILYKCQQGLLSLPQAREELRVLRLNGKINFKEVDPSGRGWIEKILISPWPSRYRDVQLGLLDDLFLETAVIPSDIVLQRCMYWIGQGPHLSLLEYLLAHGVDPSEAGIKLFPSWPSPCYIHMWEPSKLDDPFFIRSIAMLVRADLDFGSVQPLQRAILMNDFPSVKSLLNMKRSSTLSEKNFLGQMALHLAISNPSMLSHLIMNGFKDSIDAEDRNGSTPLMYAAAYNQYDSVMILLKCGANPYVLDRLNSSSFFGYVMWQGNYYLLRGAVSALDEIEGVDSKQKSLNYCLWNYTNQFVLQWVDSDYEGLQYLLQAGAECRWIFEKGNTILHLASNSNHANILLSYTSFGLNHQNSHGHTPLMLFSRLDNPLLVKQTLSAGALVNSIDKNEMNALQHAVRNLHKSIELEGKEQICSGAMDTVAVLLAADADVGNCDSCICPCSTSGCTSTSYIFQIHSRRCWSGPVLSGALWQMEWYQLLKYLRGPETLQQALRALFRFQMFEELGMTHTCCIGKYDDTHTANEKAAVEITEDAREIIEEQRELRQTLERVCSEFETRSRYSGDESWISLIARRAIFTEEAKDRLMKRMSLQEPQEFSLHALKSRNEIEIISDNPLCYVDHNTDDLYMANKHITPILSKNDSSLEKQLQEFLSAIEMYPLYENNVLSNPYNRISWDVERKRLAGLLLHEAEKVRRSPTESRNWDFDSLGPGFT